MDGTMQVTGFPVPHPGHHRYRPPYGLSNYAIGPYIGMSLPSSCASSEQQPNYYYHAPNAPHAHRAPQCNPAPTQQRQVAPPAVRPSTSTQPTTSNLTSDDAAHAERLQECRGREYPVHFCGWNDCHWTRISDTHIYRIEEDCVDPVNHLPTCHRTCFDIELERFHLNTPGFKNRFDLPLCHRSCYQTALWRLKHSRADTRLEVVPLNRSLREFVGLHQLEHWLQRRHRQVEVCETVSERRRRRLDGWRRRLSQPVEDTDVSSIVARKSFNMGIELDVASEETLRT